MSTPSRIHVVEGTKLDELLDVAAQALRGKPRGLGRLASREGIDARDALEELGAFPTSACSALDPSVVLRPSNCTASQGCSVADECSLLAGATPAAIAYSSTARLIRALLGRWSRPASTAPVDGLSSMLAEVSRLLERSPRVGAAAPPRARTSLALLDMGVRRGGPLDAFAGFLTQAEVEQVAAFVPPGSGRDDQKLLVVEGWLRQAATLEAALVEFAAGSSRR